MKVFISQKMRDLTEEEILKRRSMLIDLVKKEYPEENVEIIESWHPNFDKNSVSQLGQSIIEMSEADLVLLSETSIDNVEEFMSEVNIEKIKGSEFELLICLSYGIPYIIYILEHNENNEVTDIRWWMDE